MIYYKQDANGDRQVVSGEQHMIDSFDPCFMPIIRAEQITVYRMNKATPTCEREFSIKGSWPNRG